MPENRKSAVSYDDASASRSQDLTLCLVFILIGVGGVLFSTRWDDPVLRRITLLLSVALPVFGVGNFLARLHVTGLQKLLLIAGVLFLIVGGMVAVADLAGTFIDPDEVPPGVQDTARWAGALGLVAGLAAILFAVVRSEEELVEIGDRFRHLTEHMSEGFTLSAPDGTILLANRRFFEMAGLERGDVIGRNAHELVRELDHQTILDHLAHRKEGRATDYTISHEVGGEERHFAVSGTPIFNRRGDHAGTVAVFRDVTEQIALSRSLEKYAEGLQRLVEEQTHQLRASEERLRGLLLHMNEGFVTLDAVFRVRFANERICDLLGVEPGELVGRDIFEFVEAPGRAKLLHLLEMADDEQTKRIQQETNLLTRVRGAVPVVLGVSRVRDSREGGARYSLVVTDVSQQKEMQRQLEVRAAQLEAANEELRALDRTKDSFLTNVTHELRTPLSTIRGYIEMLDSECIGVLETEQKDALQVISRNVARLGTLIEEMIEFSRMQMRGFRLKYTLFQLEDLAEECLRSLRPTATERGLDLHYEARDTLPRIWGDRTRLAQVLTNLISNAVKFSPSGGRVTLTLGRAPDKTALVSVADTGIGIPPEHQKRVFDKFFQIDDSLERRYEGAGIGLSIAKSIVEAHGGTIELVSAPGEGSKFTVVLRDACFDASYAPGESARIEGRRIVCVSDDEALTLELAGLMQAWGGKTDCFSGGHQAIRACKRSLPDLVIADENTDGLPGETFVNLLQKTVGDHHVPVVFMRGRDAPAETDVVDLTGAVETLEKPFQAYELFWKVHRILGEEETLREVPEEYMAVAAGELDGELLHAIVEPDGDLLAWLYTALSNRGIPAVFFSGLDEAAAHVRANGAKTLVLDVDAFLGERLEQFRHAMQVAQVPVCAITGLPVESHELRHFQAALTKPFSIQEIVDTIMQLGAEPPAAQSAGAVSGAGIRGDA